MAVTSFEGKISDTILNYIESAAISLRKAYPNISFDPEQDDYLEINIVPNGRAQTTFSSQDTRQGIFQIALYGKENEGIVSAQDLMGSLHEDHCPKGKKIFGDGLIVTITDSDVGSTEIIVKGTRTPLTINYIAR